MINPESIDLDSLPWLPLEEKAVIMINPESIDLDSLLWLPLEEKTAVNVKQRWVQHHKYDDLKDIGDVKIAYLFVDCAA